MRVFARVSRSTSRSSRYDSLINDLELTLVRTAKRHDADAFHRLRSVPGIGKVLGLTILDEIHDITRFNRVQEFASYARLVKGRKQSGGKMLGTSGAKMGNVHLKWAFSEAAVLFSVMPPGGRNSSRHSKRNTAREKRSRFSLTRSAEPSSTSCRGRPSFRWRNSCRVAQSRVDQPDV
jgi:transposase